MDTGLPFERSTRASASVAAPVSVGRRAARRVALPLVLWALVLGAALASLAQLYDPSFIAIDGAFYTSAAKNLAGGQGFVSSIVSSDEHYLVGGMPVPQTNFPPGYPLLIALAGRLGLEYPHAAFLVSLLSFGGVALVLSLLLLRAGHPPARAFMASAVWLGLPLAWGNVLGCLSEMPFTLLTLVSLWCLVRSERHSNRRELWLAATGLAAGLAFTVRYQGVFYVAALGLFLVLRAIRRRDRRSVHDLIIVGGTASIFVVLLFARNQLLTGKLTGAMIREDRSLLEVPGMFMSALGGAFGFTKSGLLAGRAAELLAVGVITIGLIGGLAWIGRMALDRARLRAALARPHVSLSALYIVVSAVLMGQGARMFASGHISPRYLLPLIPFALVCLPELLRPIRFVPNPPWRTWAARAWLAAAAVAFLVGQVNVLQRERHVLTAENPYRAIGEALHRPLGGETVVRFLRARVTADSPLLGNEPQLLGAVLDRPVLGLTRASYTRKVWTNDEVRRIAKTYGVAYVVFFPGLFDPTDPEDRNQPFLHQLKGGTAPPWLVTIVADPDLRLYRIQLDQRGS